MSAVIPRPWRWWKRRHRRVHFGAGAREGCYTGEPVVGIRLLPRRACGAGGARRSGIKKRAKPAVRYRSPGTGLLIGRRVVMPMLPTVRISRASPDVSGRSSGRWKSVTGPGRSGVPQLHIMPNSVRFAVTGALLSWSIYLSLQLLDDFSRTV